MPPIEIVGEPWAENGACCVQLRIPQEDGSNVEPIARVAADRLADVGDDQVAQLLADAIADQVALHTVSAETSSTGPLERARSFLASALDLASATTGTAIAVAKA